MNIREEYKVQYWVSSAQNEGIYSISYFSMEEIKKGVDTKSIIEIHEVKTDEKGHVTFNRLDIERVLSEK